MQGTLTDQRGRDQRYKWIVVLVTIFGTFLSALDQTIINIAVPRLQIAFGADIHSVQWVLTVYLLAQGVATSLATIFQAQGAVHFGQLAKGVAPQMLQLVRMKAAVLALQDASWLTLVFVGVAVLATLFVRERRRFASPSSPRPVVME